MTKTFTIGSLRGLAAIALLLSGLAPAHAQLFAVDGQAGANSTLYTLDPTTGARIATIGSVGFSVRGLAYDTQNHTLYGSTSGTSDLITINTATGAGTLVSAFSQTVQPITYDPTTNNLYGWSTSTNSLYTLDKTTAAATLVGPSGLTTAGAGLAANTAGAIFLAGNGNNGPLYTIDKSNGSPTNVTTLTNAPGNQGAQVPALAFDSSGTLFAFSRGKNDLLTIDTTTGVITDLGATQPGLNALAFAPTATPVPETSSWVSVGFGLAWLAAGLRRKKR